MDLRNLISHELPAAVWSLATVGERVFIGDANGTIHVIDITLVDDLDPVLFAQTDGGKIGSMVGSADGKHLIAGNRVGTLYVFDVATGAQLHKLEDNGPGSKGCWALCTDSLGSIYAGTSIGAVRVWRNTYELVTTLQPEGSWLQSANVHDIVVDDEGRVCAVASFWMNDDDDDEYDEDWSGGFYGWAPYGRPASRTHTSHTHASRTYADAHGNAHARTHIYAHTLSHTGEEATMVFFRGFNPHNGYISTLVLLPGTCTTRSMRIACRCVDGLSIFDAKCDLHAVVSIAG
jgi:hypothetical protein